MDVIVIMTVPSSEYCWLNLRSRPTEDYETDIYYLLDRHTTIGTRLRVSESG